MPKRTPKARPKGGCRLLLLALLLLTGTGAWAKTPMPVHFSATVNPSPARPGEVITVTVTAAIDPGWHVYSVIATPAGPSPTEVTAANIGVPVGPTREDAPIRKMDPNFGKEVGYHEKTAVFERQYHAPQAPVTQPFVTIHYQTCNDRICLPPKDTVLPVSLMLTAGPVRPQYAKANATAPKALAAPLQTAKGAAKVGGSSASSLPLFLLAALGAGLLALVTPCVFPLIPLTLTNFVKQAGGDKAKLARLAAGYAAGIVLLYVAVGAVVAATLGVAGANQLAANPWVNLVEFLIFVVFALSFFETITMRLPANLSSWQDSAQKHGGFVGLLLLGAVFVLASFTCTAPFVGTLLVAAAGGEKFRPLLGMLVFGLAFVSPFLLFAAFPQGLSRLPKSGLWLVRVKATLGFTELAAALKFLSNTDQVWQWKILTQPVLLAAWALIFFCAALYLAGLLRFGLVAELETDEAGQCIPPARLAFTGLFAFLTLYCFWGLAGKPLSPLLGAFLPPPGYGNGANASDTGVTWLSDYDTALAQAKAQSKPLLIDFTGYTCTNCRYNEKNVFPRPEVQAVLADYVRVQLYTDGGRDAAKNQRLQQDKFGDVALPLYGIVDPQSGAVVDKIAGVVTPGEFREFLAGNSASWKR